VCGLARRAANLHTNQLHTLTTTLTRRYGTIVVEDLDIQAMGRGMGRRAFRRTVYQAGIGKVRPTLTYKSGQQGGRLVVADRWFGSSKTHHGCGGYLADLRLDQRVWVCPQCGLLVDRNANAALNLRDWTGPVDDRDVQRGGVAAAAPFVGQPRRAGSRAGGACEAPQDHPRVAGADDARTQPQPRLRSGTPSRGTSQQALTNAH
jgi:putative transposase